MSASSATGLAVTACVAPHSGQGLFDFSCYMKDPVTVFALVLVYLASKYRLCGS